MKILTNCGFTRDGWRSGKRGEYLVLIQGLLLVGFIFLPTYHLPGISLELPKLIYSCWIVAALFMIAALVLIAKGLLDLGKNLTPLPYPRVDGELVQTGVYGIVRHPLYSGLIFLTLGWSIFQLSLSHFVAVIVIFLFLDLKARQEETWLSEKYPEYSDYQQRVKKLIPRIY
ncbi:MAG: isoprenylcysteine carboxylmethyltransferase family protein [Okeania sp. SIO2G4]|uniref:methyltransferase family protein n=1 Tax=unclassified Okeania TaxID=2634635 RepID=UPI0013BE2B2A|nr:MULTISPECIES: isoprenylcysteine carboxylmethyltransferase family protein [unclassified Okeania]NEP04358.1 isoprenylcysteine carboxylmethyltransferase family protein [Okeania sp. SIO4D6]NEP41458.1 isoprenylcysteine carboxylmethyltransferase family protein [Okeania sp. SIO2H7]NEP73259.1 isoprenylcysteine carboxylmethyltransferase family protein [Okeania sp. SIO2G5]NEP94124.1 isoprenylcysteine carboxylmethyltransferase family protein [Okeania sp. SIO2F5]NEQ91954.1 isoprenylcysteine carboxylmet